MSFAEELATILDSHPMFVVGLVRLPDDVLQKSVLEARDILRARSHQIMTAAHKNIESSKQIQVRMAKRIGRPPKKPPFPEQPAQEPPVMKVPEQTDAYGRPITPRPLRRHLLPR